jgi:cytochrome c oxidase subunit IV
MHVVAEKSRMGMGKYLFTYVAILVVAGLQFIAAYYDAGNPNLWKRLTILAIIEGMMAVLFFMHLWMERRAFLWSMVILIVFLLLSMQFSWPDSFRLLYGVPWNK